MGQRPGGARFEGLRSRAVDRPIGAVDARRVLRGRSIRRSDARGARADRVPAAARSADRRCPRLRRCPRVQRTRCGLQRCGNRVRKIAAGVQIGGGRWRWRRRHVQDAGCAVVESVLRLARCGVAGHLDAAHAAAGAAQHRPRHRLAAHVAQRVRNARRQRRQQQGQQRGPAGAAVQATRHGAQCTAGAPQHRLVAARRFHDSRARTLAAGPRRPR